MAPQKSPAKPSKKELREKKELEKLEKREKEKSAKAEKKEKEKREKKDKKKKKDSGLPPGFQCNGGDQVQTPVAPVDDVAGMQRAAGDGADVRDGRYRECVL